MAKKVKIKKQRDTTKIEERAKSVANIQPPDANPHKKENENNIDHYFRFGRAKGGGKKFKSIKDESRHKNK